MSGSGSEWSNSDKIREKLVAAECVPNQFCQQNAMRSNYMNI